jgi:hypothetical protein
MEGSVVCPDTIHSSRLLAMPVASRLDLMPQHTARVIDKGKNQCGGVGGRWGMWKLIIYCSGGD